MAIEPLAKLVSGDRLPHFGPFPSCNFAPWNHHAAHSISKMDSKWDCRSSTQSFARGSIVNRKTRHSYHILETGASGIAEAHCIIRNDKRHAMKGFDPQHQGPVSQT